MKPLAQLYKLRLKEQMIKSEIEKLRQSIIKDMGRKKKIEESGYEAKLATQSRESIDLEKLIKDVGVKGIAKYKKTSTFKKLRINKIAA